MSEYITRIECYRGLKDVKYQVYMEIWKYYIRRCNKEYRDLYSYDEGLCGIVTKSGCNVTVVYNWRELTSTFLESHYMTAMNIWSVRKKIWSVRRLDDDNSIELINVLTGAEISNNYI